MRVDGVPYEQLLSLACQAPSVQNSQPWRWRLREPGLDLLADPSRQPMHADPTGRDLLISCGAALHHLQAASVALGWDAVVRRLPDLGNPHHLATVVFEPATAGREAEADLRAIMSRRTNRRQLSRWPVPLARLTQLADEASAWGVHVIPVVDEADRERLAGWTR